MIEGETQVSETLEQICSHVRTEHRKGKIPLFIIGAGISSSLRSPEGRPLNKGIPDMVAMIQKIKALSDTESLPRGLHELLETWESSDARKRDRSIVCKILVHFHEPTSVVLQRIWGKFIEWLLHSCVDEEEKIGIVNAQASVAHEKIAEMYSEANAVCLTVNFDSLMYRALSARFDKFDKKGNIRERKAYTYFEPEMCEDFLKRIVNEDAVAEIQARGDVFWAQCSRNPLCNLRNKRIPLIASEQFGLQADDPTRCRCGEPRDILIAFPGTYQKDRIMQQTLSKIWRYLASRISCVFTIGLSGAWDPILTAFISDLVGERTIPLTDVNIDPENSDLVRELVYSGTLDAVSVKQPADEFMARLVDEYRACDAVDISYVFESHYEDIGNDHHWDDILGASVPRLNEITDYEQEILTAPVVRISSKFTQLGLKSKWLGVDSRKRRDHNRLSHSKGVMKIASFVYDEACRKSGREGRDNEKQFLRIAALLHDIGHLPFCHLVEEIFRELNWKPSSYVESFGHGLYTEEKVRKLAEENNLQEYLNSVGYGLEDLIRLTNGEFGVGFLDAILNSPVDADKIDYVFRDAMTTNTRIPLDEKDFVLGLVEEIRVTPEGLLAFSGYSAKLAMELLDARQHLYNNLYLSPEVRFLESAVRFIITTYFVHKYNIIQWEDISEAVSHVKDANALHGISDLGALRIQLATHDLEKLVEDNVSEDDIELAILGTMKDQLLTKPVREEVKEMIRLCYELVSKTDGREELLKIESERIVHREELEKLTGGPTRRVQDVRKTVMLRFPGVLLIDIVPSPARLSVPEKRRAKDRSDGTCEYLECILVPSGRSRFWRRNRDPADAPLIGTDAEKQAPPYVYIYQIGQESDVTQAVDLFVRLLRQERLLEEVE